MVPELDASDANKVQIQRIVLSKAFKTSEVHRNLLHYLAEKSLSGDAQNLKEYTVGLDVFGKPATYDPRQESVVRMHVGRLRQKLTEYYRTEGQNDPVIVDLPKGAFTLTFALRPVADVEPPPMLPGRRAISPREIALASSLLLAIVCAGYFGLRLFRVEKTVAAASPPPWTPELQQLWGPLLSSDRPLMVTLATDPFHTVSAQGISIAAVPAGAAGASASGVTGVGTANAAFLLGQFLGQRKRNVFPIRSDLLSMGEIAMGDIIFVGSTVGKPQIQAIPPVDQPFVLTPEGVKNLKPAPGEPAFLADSLSKGPQDFEESHALVSNLPGLYGNGKILYLSGNTIASVMGAVQALTDPVLARQLVASLQTSSGVLPQFYQVVLKVKAMDDTPIDVSSVFHRELQLLKSASGAGSSR